MQQPAEHAQYAAPTLKPADIAALLTSLGINCTTEDISKPTAEKTREIMQRLVAVVFFDNSPDVTAPKFAAMQHIDHPDLHDEAIPELIFIHYLYAHLPPHPPRMLHSEANPGAGRNSSMSVASRSTTKRTNSTPTPRR